MPLIEREIYDPKTTPPAIGPFSKGVRVGNTLYLSGSVGVDSKGQIVAGGIESETRQALLNLGEVLKSAGVDFKNVVKTTVLLANMDDFNAMNGVYKEFFTSSHPARAAYQVARLPRNAKVEIEAVAVVGEIVEKSKL